LQRLLYGLLSIKVRNNDAVATCFIGERGGQSADTDPVDKNRHMQSANAQSLGAMDVADFGPDSHPFADINRLAQVWSTAKVSRSQYDASAYVGSPGPGSISLAAEKLGLHVVCEERSITGLETADLPAVIMMGNGSSRLILSRPDSNHFILGLQNGEKHVSVASLAAAASSTIFRLRPIEEAERSLAPTAGQKISPLTFVREAIGYERRKIAHLCLASLLINIFGLSLPLFSMAVFDRIIPHGAYETLWAMAGGVVLVLGLEILVRQSRQDLSDAVAQAVVFKIQERLGSRLLFAPLGNLPRAAGGVLQPIHELEALGHLMPLFIVSLAVDLPFFLIIMAYLSVLGGPIVFAPLVGILVLIGLHFLSHRLAAKAHEGLTGYIKRQAQLIIEAIALQERVRITGAGNRLFGLWEQSSDNTGFAAHRVRHWQGLATQGSAILVQVVIVGTILIGVYQIGTTNMTIGALSAAMLLTSRAIMPISILAGMIFRVAQLAKSTAQLGPLLSARPETGGGRSNIAASSHRAEVSFHGVTYSYPDQARPVLRDISLSIRSGEKVGLIGKTGCGKSTLLKLIARLHQPTEGRILCDGHDIHQFDPASLRQVIAYMQQDTDLFDMTLEDNLMIGLTSVDPEHFERVVRISGVHDFASQHPSGYGLSVGPSGRYLSGGERQSTSLARAMMGRPRLLMLDEPSSAMDNGLEARLIAELATSLSETGLIVATHRLPLLALVDRIIWLDGGRIVADGPKDQVFAKIGLAA
jgi:ATP-binding cassette, subfamily C, bacterial LapB